MNQRRRELRNRMTDAEAKLWFHLKSKQILGFKFRRQFSFDDYIVDFYCPAAKLVIEIDGDTHFEVGARLLDQTRQRHIESFGIAFLRFTNNDINDSIDGVISSIKEFLSNQTPSNSPL